MGDQDRKAESSKDTEREETIKDLDLSDQEGEQVKGGMKITELPKK